MLTSRNSKLNGVHEKQILTIAILRCNLQGNIIKKRNYGTQSEKKIFVYLLFFYCVRIIMNDKWIIASKQLYCVAPAQTHLLSTCPNIYE